MLFSSNIFIFLFLPLLLLVYYLSGKSYRNTILFAGSLVFFAWGGVSYSLVLLLSLVLNFFIGRNLGGPDKSKSKKYLWLGVGINLIVLFIFKYTGFIIENLNLSSGIFGFTPIKDPGIVLPIGISFYTFQAISYLVDVHRNTVEPQRNFIRLGLFISLFPQLIAGPIVRYQDIAQQIIKRTSSWVKFGSGVERFIIGLAKKVLLANTFAATADQIFSSSIHSLDTLTAWLGILCYSFQIYFDFSGYSDMAIGLGRMFGFKINENFNFPYVARSIQDFWRRWHISLSTWFRDYMYIPLGGNRVGKRRLYLNLIIVFFLTGFWHGASWSFVVWGLIHGLFLILERVGLGKILKRLPKFVGHFYTLFVVILAWVFFRIEDVAQSGEYISRLLNPTFFQGSDMVMFFLDRQLIVALIAGIVFSTNTRKLTLNIYSFVVRKGQFFIIRAIPQILYTLLMLILFIGSVSMLVANTYNPFIYFRF